MKRVVVADDNKFILEQIIKDLKQCDKIEIVGTANNGKEELEIIRKMKPDVVITDIEMPYMTGIDVIETMQAEEYVPEFIVITGGTSTEIMKKMFNLPIKMLLNKPINSQRLIDEILDDIEIKNDNLNKNEKIKIIIADDEKECSDKLKSNLSKFDEIEILGVANSDEEEIKMIEELKPDIVITDLLRNNQFTGLDIIKKYAEKNEKLKFLIVSYSSESSTFIIKNVVGFVCKYPEVDYEKIRYILKATKEEKGKEVNLAKEDINTSKPIKKNFLEKLKKLFK